MKNSGKSSKTTAKKAGRPAGTGFITELDRYLFGQGTHYKIFEKLGAHPRTYGGKRTLPSGRPMRSLWASLGTSMDGIRRRLP